MDRYTDALLFKLRHKKSYFFIIIIIYENIIPNQGIEHISQLFDVNRKRVRKFGKYIYFSFQYKERNIY